MQIGPICQQEHADEKAVIRPLSKKVHRLVKRGFDPDKPSKPIGQVVIHGYDRLAAIQRATDNSIGALPPPPGDEGTIASWLQLRAKFTQVLQRAGHVYAHQGAKRSFKLFVRALHTEDQAEKLIETFGPTPCGRIVPGF